MKLKDRIIGILGILISVILLVSLRGKGMETGAFPSILLIALLILSLALIARNGKQLYELQKFGNILVYFTLTLVYMIGLPYMGFIVSTILFISAFLIISRYPVRTHIILALSSLISLVLWFIFSYLVGINMPAILFA